MAVCGFMGAEQRTRWECRDGAAIRKGFQWDPTDACLNEGGEGQGTRGGSMLPLHAHLRVEDCFWFCIRIQDEMEAAHRHLRMCRVNLLENASESVGL